MFPGEQKLYETRIENFLKRLLGQIYESEIPLDGTISLYSGRKSFEERAEGTFRRVEVGEAWGRNWQRAWFHLVGMIPEDWAGKSVVARLRLGGEGLVYSSDGRPFTAVSVHSIWESGHFFRERVRLADPARGGESVDLWVDATAGQLFGLKLMVDQGDTVPQEFGSYTAIFEKAVIAVFRSDIWQLYLDAVVLFDLLKSLPENSVRRARILRALNRCVDCFRSDPQFVARARRELQQVLSHPHRESDLRTVAVGHAHLDTAWLWPISETIDKCARSFAAQIDLLKRYPDFVFGASQPQQYEFVKIHFPNLFESIRQMVQAGRWEPLGGMWVEADCNLPGGESLVRQILYGKKFFMQEFGVDVRNLWLPDAFGYPASLPQIMKKSGLEFFVSQKLSWNQFNHFPYHTFRWRGIDGSEVISHFPPENDYNSELKPSRLRFAAENFEEKAFIDEFLTLFGIGDGGGGPTEEFIEFGLRQQNLEGVPAVRFDTAQSFLDELRHKKAELPIWQGELYMEGHRGTYTTHAWLKRKNRKTELALREMEILYSFLPPKNYPAEELEKLWKVLLLHQFHDIIPGSSITPVYESAQKAFSQLELDLRVLKNRCASELFSPDENRLVFFNSLSVPFANPIALPDDWHEYEVEGEDGSLLAFQVEQQHTTVLPEIPPFSFLQLRKGKKRTEEETADFPDSPVLENDRIRYEFSRNGTIGRIWDKEADREVLPPGKEANLLQLFEDRPAEWDAWDVDIYYENQLLETARLKGWRWICNGPVRQGIECTFTVGSSQLIQKIFLPVNSKRLDFYTVLFWREDHKMLRVAVPVNILNAEATYEIQFGLLKRPTHRNTSWDFARFEVVGHRFADLSNESYGVALLNDCKFGYKIYDQTIELNLVRAPSLPDPKADRGEHHFVYSIYPHCGRVVESDVLAQGLQLNQPPMRFVGSLTKGKNYQLPLIPQSQEVILETVKRSEDGKGWIVRLYEPYGREATVPIHCRGDIQEVWETDLLENSIQKLDPQNGDVRLKFTPFEIKTLRCLGKGASKR